MTTQTVTAIPAPRTPQDAGAVTVRPVRRAIPDDGHTPAGIEYFEEAFARIAERVAVPGCSFTGEPVWNMAEHAIPGGCVECFDYYVMEA